MEDREALLAVIEQHDGFMHVHALVGALTTKRARTKRLADLRWLVSRGLIERRRRSDIPWRKTTGEPMPSGNAITTEFRFLKPWSP